MKVRGRPSFSPMDQHTFQLRKNCARDIVQGRNGVQAGGCVPYLVFFPGAVCSMSSTSSTTVYHPSRHY